MKPIITFLISICLAVMAKSQTDSPGELQGRVYDASTNEGIPFAPVVLETNGALQALGQTDDNGNYTIKPLAPGSYELIVQYLGYAPVHLNGINIVADRISFQNVLMKAGENTIVCVEVVDRSPRRSARHDNCTPVRSNVIEQNAIAVSTDHSAGVGSSAATVTQAEIASPVVGGCRVYAPVYYIDGIRVDSTRLPVSILNPSSCIEQISIITGGLPAKYEYTNSLTHIPESEIDPRFSAKDFPRGYTMQVHF